MQLSRIDQADPVPNLFAALLGDAPWDGMLRALLARTRAQRVRLAIRHADTAPADTLHCRVAGAGWTGPVTAAENLTIDQLIDLQGLRAGRVYALEELRPLGPAGWADLLDKAQLGDARLLRIAGGDGYTAWLILLDQRPAFGAADSAQLTALIPAVEIAIGLLAGIDLLRARATTAEATLASLGISQAILDRQGQVLAGAVGVAASRAALADCCATLASAPAEAARLLPPGRDDGTWLRVRGLRPPATALPRRPVALATQRPPRPADPAAMQPAIGAIFRLSAQEARLAALLASGVTLDQAGRQLGLARETARSYTKKVYAKTGATGQVDLATRILTSLAPLA